MVSRVIRQHTHTQLATQTSWSNGHWSGLYQRVGGVLEAPRAWGRGGLPLAMTDIDSCIVTELECVESQSVAQTTGEPTETFFKGKLRHGMQGPLVYSYMTNKEGNLRVLFASTEYTWNIDQRGAKQGGLSAPTWCSSAEWRVRATECCEGIGLETCDYCRTN